ncbi:MAG: hypothetical protein VX627_01750 [Candidatus Thermoplasmatota archaeon]|nr:hypothetical protein [Candidatus Thermoplasmatota archaeon]
MNTEFDAAIIDCRDAAEHSVEAWCRLGMFAEQIHSGCHELVLNLSPGNLNDTASSVAVVVEQWSNELLVAQIDAQYIHDLANIVLDKREANITLDGNMLETHLLSGWHDAICYEQGARIQADGELNPVPSAASVRFGAIAGYAPMVLRDIIEDSQKNETCSADSDWNDWISWILSHLHTLNTLNATYSCGVWGNPWCSSGLSRVPVIALELNSLLEACIVQRDLCKLVEILEKQSSQHLEYLQLQEQIERLRGEAQPPPSIPLETAEDEEMVTEFSQEEQEIPANNLEETLQSQPTQEIPIDGMLDYIDAEIDETISRFDMILKSMEYDDHRYQATPDLHNATSNVLTMMEEQIKLGTTWGNPTDTFERSLTSIAYAKNHLEKFEMTEALKETIEAIHAMLLEKNPHKSDGGRCKGRIFISRSLSNFKEFLDTIEAEGGH